MFSIISIISIIYHFTVVCVHAEAVSCIPVCVDGTFVRFYGETFTVLLQSLLEVTFLDQIIAFLFQ